MDLSSPEEGGGGGEIPHVPGQLNAEELYAVPVKRRGGSRRSPGAGAEEERPLLTGLCQDEREDEEDEEEDGEALPPGWERHEGKQRVI